MEKIKKDYKPKFVPLILAIVLLFNGIAYGVSLSTKTKLRIPVAGDKNIRFEEVLSRFEQVMASPILNTDKYIIEELKLVFELIGNIEVRIVQPEELPSGRVSNIERDGNGSVIRVLCSDKITSEGLINLLGEIRSIGSVKRWIDVVFDLQDYFAQWSNILRVYSQDTGIAEDVKKEFIKLSRYFNSLEKKVREVFDIQEEEKNIPKMRYFGRETNIERVKRVIEHQLKLSKEGEVNVKDRIKRLEDILAHDLSKRLSDAFDRILMGKMFDEFMSLVSSWDDPVARKGLLYDIIGEENVEELENWVDATQTQFKTLTELNKENPEKLQGIHIETAKRLARFMKSKFPTYRSRVFHLAEASDINRANCVAYSTMFYVISKEIGLDCNKIGVVHYNEDVTYVLDHAAALVHLPAYQGKKSFILIELTADYGDIVSKPIQEDSVAITYQDGLFKHFIIPEKFYSYDHLVEYSDPLIAISDSIYSWMGDLIERHSDQDKISKRMAERRLRVDPNNYRGLMRLGYFFSSDSANLPYKALISYGYYKRSLRQVLNLGALRDLISLARHSGREKDYEEFCKELLQKYKSPEAYTIIAKAYEDEHNRPKRNLKKAISVLIRGNKEFPEDLKIIIGLSRSYLKLAEKETNPEKKANMMERGISYLEKAITREPENRDLFHCYEAYAFYSDEEALKERYLKFCEEMKSKNPKAGMPIVYLMRSHTGMPTKEGFIKAFELAKEYLESSEPKNRETVLKELRKLYSPFSDVEPEYMRILNAASIGTLDDFLTYLFNLNRRFPESYATIGAIADVLVELKRYEDAVVYLKGYFTRGFEDKGRKASLITCLFKLQRWQKIVELEDDFINLDLDGHSTILMAVGIAFQTVGEYAKAIKYFEIFLGYFERITELKTEADDVRKRIEKCRQAINNLTNPAINVTQAVQRSI